MAHCSILRAAHLIPVYGSDFISETNFDSTDSLDAFQAFYVSKYTDCRTTMHIRSRFEYILHI
ncbi:hypothetical protein GGX14DRAFT_367812 [Mycena pura]|uniref:Uncharacterized protein n=1 Tax=Mycena pura TaxID=153505 RepID=A0AAD6VCD8_9AGAR|nr:hypothetical protein GGX14DRAFT_367812 [Mycena pura]